MQQIKILNERPSQTSKAILLEGSTVIPFLSLRDHVMLGGGEPSNEISTRNFSPATAVTSRLRLDESTLGLTEKDKGYIRISSYY